MDETRLTEVLDDELAPLRRELVASLSFNGEPKKLESATALGARFLDRKVPPSEAARRTLAAGRALESELRLDGAAGRRFAVLVDDAAVQVAAAVERAGRARRQSFLAYLAHELKNPLNTVLNALWLLREKGSDHKQSARFLELAERAVRRIEERARHVRELDEELVVPPPGWQGQSAVLPQEDA
jgi:signal transduction histidine kinase